MVACRSVMLISCSGCRKGKRECTYPGTPSSATSTKSSRGHPRPKESLHDSGSSLSDDEEDSDEKSVLPPIPDDEEESEPQSGTSGHRNSSVKAFVGQNEGLPRTADGTPGAQRCSTRPQAVRTSSKHSVKPSISQSSRWATLPRDIKAYLKYHRDSLSHHHYAFKYDTGDFLKTTFLEIAMNDDSQALLYAVVAFAAYHHAVSQGNERVSTFLSYFNKAITMLQHSLSKRRHSVTTLLTILQLATIEVRMKKHSTHCFGSH